MMRVARRTVLVWCTCAVAVPALASVPRVGCLASTYLPDSFAEGDPVDTSWLDEMTGDPALEMLQTAVRRIPSFFGINPGIGIYDDSDAPNALAYQEGFLPETSGTVALGKTLLQREIQRDGGGPSILAIAAHEFGHVLQYTTGARDRLALPNGAVKHVELHADLLAGIYLGRLQLEYPDISLCLAGETFRRLGDTQYGDPRHHGGPDERLAAAERGFSIGQNQRGLAPQAVSNDAIEWIQQTFPAVRPAVTANTIVRESCPSPIAQSTPRY